jgi:hypothetical protein
VASRGLEAVVRSAAVVGLAGALLLLAATLEARQAERAEKEWLDPAAAEAASAVVARFASLAAHLRATSGDSRFADRIPADPPVVGELVADIAFAQHQGLVERAQLVRIERRSLEAVGLDVAELRATEYWITRSEGPAGPATRSDVVSVRYALRRDAGGWRVADWALDDGAAEVAEPRR